MSRGSSAQSASHRCPSPGGADGSGAQGPVPGAVTGRAAAFLRAEGVVLFAAAVAVDASTSQPWWLMLLVLLVPGVSMLGYPRTPSFGALLYNAAHSYPLPGLLGAAAVGAGSPVLQALAAVWFAHIGLDRALGYGLKHDDGFAHTHLGTRGAAGLGAAHASRTGR